MKYAYVSVLTITASFKGTVINKIQLCKGRLQKKINHFHGVFHENPNRQNN